MIARRGFPGSCGNGTEMIWREGSVMGVKWKT